MQRRNFLSTAGVSLAGLSFGAARAADTDPKMPAPGPLVAPGPNFAAAPPLAPIRASVDRIIAINVCTRPFRPQGPRIEAERMGRKTVIHNYGHGGSGWSLSWGSGVVAVELAKATKEKSIAVIGCGALGITAARVAQRAGLKVRIYTKDRLPEVRSSWAAGVWSPSSRICTLDHSTPEFEKRWEMMARYSYRMYGNLLGLPGDPVEYKDNYALSDLPFGGPPTPVEGEPLYTRVEERTVPDLQIASVDIPAGKHPFKAPYVRRSSRLTFNLAGYSHMMMNDFLIAGGEIETVDFKSPKEWAALKEKTIINCTGYGARALLGDETIVPVRGQTVRLVPQPELTYGLSYSQQHVSMIPRRDGLIVSAGFPGDFNNASTEPDMAVSAGAITRLAALFPGT